MNLRQNFLAQRRKDRHRRLHYFPRKSPIARSPRQILMNSSRGGRRAERVFKLCGGCSILWNANEKPKYDLFLPQETLRSDSMSYPVPSHRDSSTGAWKQNGRACSNQRPGIHPTQYSVVGNSGEPARTKPGTAEFTKGAAKNLLKIHLAIK